MKVLFNKSFIKQYQKTPREIQEKFQECVAIFKKDPRNRSLNIHKLRGKKEPFVSMNVTGNYRVLFLREGKEVVVFYEIGTHSQLY